MSKLFVLVKKYIRYRKYLRIFRKMEKHRNAKKN